jgi:uncharacterized protein Veg
MQSRKLTNMIIGISSLGKNAASSDDGVLYQVYPTMFVVNESHSI